MNAAPFIRDVEIEFTRFRVQEARDFDPQYGFPRPNKHRISLSNAVVSRQHCEHDTVLTCEKSSDLLAAMTKRYFVIAIVAIGIAGCGSSTPTRETVNFPDANDPAYAAQFNQPMDPRISSSAGETGGVVVLWPRVVPGEGVDWLREHMGAVQTRLHQIAERVYGNAPIDVRPAPQRTCPKQGCAGVALGALVLWSGNGCAILALVSPPGQESTSIIPWSGDVELKKHSVGFRSPPEDQVTTKDMIPCDKITETLDQLEPEVEKAVRAAKGSAP